MKQAAVVIVRPEAAAKCFNSTPAFIYNAGFFFYLVNMVMLKFFEMFYTIFFVWLAGIAAAVVLRKHITFSYRFFAWLIIFITVMETITSVMAFNNVRNHFVFNIFDPVNFFTVAFFYYYHLHSLFIKKIIIFYLWVFPLLVFINAVWIQSFFNLNTHSYVFGGSFILLLSVAYIWQLYNSDETHSIFRDPVFWFSLAYLFYCAISVPYLGMLNYLNEQYLEFSRQYYIVYNGAIIIKNILLTAGFLCIIFPMKQN
jgi:hypothetical protein